MAKYIAHSSIDERGKISGGSAGDQTGKEVCIRAFYDKPFTEVLRIENKEVREQFANNMIDCTNNSNVGYDQGGRNTILTEAEKVNFDFLKIATKCESDCSSIVTACVLGAIYKVLGKDAYLKAKAVLVVSGNCATTSTLKTRLQNVGVIKITVYTSTTYTRGTSKAVYGDIYNKPGSHVVAYIDDGNKRTSSKTEVYKLKTLKMGSTGNDVTIFESIMKKMGYYTGKIDTEFGSGCLSACNKFQTKYPECGTNGKPDGEFGPKCWAKALSLLGA